MVVAADHQHELTGELTMKAINKSLLVLLLVFFAQAAFAQNTIDSCGTEITSSGAYLVTQNLINTSGACIRVLDATDVTVDCQGYRLTGDGTGDGIWVTNSSKGVVIRNCDIYSFQYGIHYRGDNGVVEYNKVVDNYHGIRLSQGYGDEVRWNTGNDNVYGMYIDLSYDDNYIYENTFHQNDYGIYCHRGARNYFVENQLNLNNARGLWFYSTCFDNFIWNNTANLNTNGFFIQSGSYGNDFYKNVLNRNDARGINDGAGDATQNTYEDNVCKNNGIEPSTVAGACK
jgi:parallel beta-helix repeat protein